MYLRVSPVISRLFQVDWLAKCPPTIMLELNSCERFGEGKKEMVNLSSNVHVVHRSAKQAISRRGKNDNDFEMYKNEKRKCKAAKCVIEDANL